MLPNFAKLNTQKIGVGLLGLKDELLFVVSSGDFQQLCDIVDAMSRSSTELIDITTLQNIIAKYGMHPYPSRPPEQPFQGRELPNGQKHTLREFRLHVMAYCHLIKPGLGHAFTLPHVVASMRKALTTNNLELYNWLEQYGDMSLVASPDEWRIHARLNAKYVGNVALQRLLYSRLDMSNSLNGRMLLTHTMIAFRHANHELGVLLMRQGVLTLAPGPGLFGVDRWIDRLYQHTALDVDSMPLFQNMKAVWEILDADKFHPKSETKQLAYRLAAVANNIETMHWLRNRYGISSEQAIRVRESIDFANTTNVWLNSEAHAVLDSWSV